MNCETIRNLILDRCDAPLSAPEETVVREHLAECHACREYADLLGEALGELHTLPAPELSPAQQHHIWKQVKKSMPRKSLPLFIRLPLYAASAAVIFWAGLTAGRQTEPGSSPGFIAFAPTVSCQTLYQTDYPVDPFSVYHWKFNANAAITIRPDNTQIHLPQNLMSHGPYSVRENNIEAAANEACIPYVSQFGNVLVLHLTQSSHPGDAGVFQINQDETKVLFNRIIWRENGWQWTLEGRLPVKDLYDLALEVSGKVQI